MAWQAKDNFHNEDIMNTQGMSSSRPALAVHRSTANSAQLSISERASATGKERWYPVVITSVDMKGHNGRYIVTRQDPRNGPIEIDGSITVSHKHLPPGAPPEPPTIAWVSDVRRKKNGWRAYRMKYHSPGDQLSLPLLQIEGGS